MGQQLVDADDQDAFIGIIARFATRDHRLVGGALLGGGIGSAHGILELADTQIGARNGDIEIVALGKAKLGGDIVDLGTGFAHALQFARNDRPPFGN